jgi:hypothetical protein
MCFKTDNQIIYFLCVEGAVFATWHVVGLIALNAENKKIEFWNKTFLRVQATLFVITNDCLW